MTWLDVDGPSRSSATSVPDEGERLAVLAGYGHPEPDPHLQRLVEFAASAMDVPMARVCLSAADRQQSLACVGRPGQQDPPEDELCTRVVRTGLPLIVGDLAGHEGSVAGSDQGGLRFYAGAPLIDDDGWVLGALSVMDIRPHTLTEQGRRLLAALAALAVTRLQLCREHARVEQDSASLRQVASRLEALLDHADALIYVKDQDGRFLVANHALHDLLGLEPGTMPGGQVQDLMPPVFAEQHLRSDARVRTAGESLVFEEHASSDDGVVHHFVSTKFPLPDGKGEPTLVGGVSLDITALTAARTQLWETRQRYHAMVEESATGVALLDVESLQVLFVNPRITQLFAVASADGLQERIGGDWMRLLLIRAVAQGRISETRVAGVQLFGLPAPESVDVAATAVQCGGRPAVQLEIRDVTDASHLEESAARGERVLALVEMSPTGVFEAGPDGAIVIANDALERKLGFEPGALVGTGLADLMDAADAATAQRAIEATVQGRQDTWRHELTLLNRDGQRLPALVAVNALRSPDGRLQCLIGTVTDLSSVEKLPEALAMRQSALAAAQHVAGVGSWSEDLRTGEMIWSDVLREMLALPDRVQPSHGLFQSLVVPDQGDAVWDRMLNSAPGAIPPKELRMRRWDGEERIFELRGERVFGSDGHLAYHHGTMQDVTEAVGLKRRLLDSEARARQLLQAVPDAVVVTDVDGRIETINREASTLFGYSEGELIGRPVEMLIPSESHDAHRAHRAQYSSSTTPTVMSTGPGVAAVRKDGSRVPVEVNLSRIEVPRGQAILASVRDVSDSRALQRELAAARDLFGGVLSAATEQSIIATDTRGHITVFNTGAERMLGYLERDMLGSALTALHDRGQLERAGRELGLAPGFDVLVAGVAPGRSQTREWEYVTSGQDRLTVSLSVGAMADVDGGIVGYIGIAQDVSAQRRAEAALGDSEQRFRLAFDNAIVGMAMLSLEPGSIGQFLRVNAAMCAFTGHAEDELVGRGVLEVTDPRDVEASRDGMDRLLSHELESLRFEKRFLHAAGHSVWGLVSSSRVRPSEDSPAYLLSVIEDISVRKQAEAELTQQALHDPLTGLPNRTLLADHLTHALLRARRSGSYVGVLFLDLDDFKLINDSLGHDAGDEFLVRVAGILTGCLRDTDTAARIGGDEFVMVCEDLKTVEEITAVTKRVERALHVDVTLRGRTIAVSGSIGVSVSNPESTTESILREADTAMYRAKQGGKGRSEVAGSEPAGWAADQWSLEAGLREAVTEGQLRLLYQPCIDLDSGRTVAAEALLRWQHPEHGLLEPRDFLDLAEERDLITGLGEWAIQEAVEQGSRWLRELGEAAPEVWVNVSSRQLGQQRLGHTVADALQVSGLPAGRLCLEFTERQLIAAAHSVRADLEVLPELGVRLAIDDFGVSQHGLDYLRDMPVSTIKINKAYVKGLGVDRTDTALTSGILTLAGSLELTAVAEGVETADQRDRLRDLGCHLAQGYYLGRPVTAEVFPLNAPAPVIETGEGLGDQPRG